MPTIPPGCCHRLDCRKVARQALPRYHAPVLRRAREGVIRRGGEGRALRSGAGVRAAAGWSRRAQRRMRDRPPHRCAGSPSTLPRNWRRPPNQARFWSRRPCGTFCWAQPSTCDPIASRALKMSPATGMFSPSTAPAAPAIRDAAQTTSRVGVKQRTRDRTNTSHRIAGRGLLGLELSTGTAPQSAGPNGSENSPVTPPRRVSPNPGTGCP